MVQTIGAGPKPQLHPQDSEWKSMTTPLHLHFPPLNKTRWPGFTQVGMDRLNCLCIRVGRFSMYMHKWGLSPNVTCECGTEEQTPDHILCTCTIYQPLHGLCGLVELDESMKMWLLEGCPDIESEDIAYERRRTPFPSFEFRNAHTLIY